MKSIALSKNSKLIQDFIEREQARKMIAIYNSVFAMQLLLGVTLLIGAHNLFEPQQLALWFFFHALFLILRKVLILWHSKNSETEVLPKSLELASLLLVACSSCVWGSTAFVLDFEHYPQESVFIMAITLGIGVGATVLGSVWYRYFYYFLVPFMTLFVVAFIIGVPNTSFLLAFVYIAFAAFALRTTSISYKNSVEHLSLIKENEILVQTTNQFIAAASHDLRQPSQALSLLISALGESTQQVDRDKLIGHLQKSSSTLNNLLNNILDVSKFNSETFQAELRPTNLQETFKLLDTNYRPKAISKEIGLIVEGKENWVETDPVMIERLLSNLIDNAIRYTNNGSVKLTCEELDGHRVQITVSDTGIGIAKEKQAYVFEPFYQADNSERNSIKGFGLGLSIVQRISQKLNLNLDFESKEGVGTTFKLTLSRTEKPNLSVSRDVATEPWGLHSKNILVIEDNDTVLEGLILQFSNWEMNAITARNMQEALIKVQSPMKFDVFLSDLRLQNGDNGMDVIDRIKSIKGNSEIPAIILSGDTGTDIIDEVAQRGFVMLHKPTKPAHLRSVIQRCIFSK